MAFGDLVAAQQILATDVTAYLGVLGSLWTSVVTFADYIQTDDLFQLGKPLELPKLPDLDLHEWPCPHPPIAGEQAEVGHAPTPVGSAGGTTAPAPTVPPMPGQRPQPPIAGEPARFDLTATPVAGTGVTTASTTAVPPTRGPRIDTAATSASVARATSSETTPAGP